METEVTKLAPSQLLLDPNNYRFLDLPNYKRVSKRSRFAEDGVQQKAKSLLTDTSSFDLDSLMESIKNNGFVPLDQLVVEEYDEDDDGTKRYLITEGNRRAAAVMTLLDDAAAGAIDMSDEVAASLESLPVIIVSGSADERDKFHKTLMAIRHVSGIREWGAYQQAKLVVEMYEDEGSQFGQVAKKIGISSQEVGRRYRASKALQQMEKDDEFSAHAHPRLYSFFHEAVSQPKVRDWLEFTDETFSAENEEAKRLFYEILSPREIDGEKKGPKLENANRQVRQLKFIVENDKALAVLSDPEKSFEDALSAIDDDLDPDSTGIIEAALKVALKALRKPGVDAWSDPSEKASKLWDDLVKVFKNIEKVIEDE